MLKHAFTALHKRVLSPRFFVRSPDGLIYQRTIDRTPVAFSSTIFPLYIPLPSCSRHHRQHAVIHFNSSICRSNPIRDRRYYGASVQIYEMFRGGCKDLASCTAREIQHGDRSSVSLFLVYNDMLFFLVFNTLSLQNFKRGVAEFYLR